MTIPEIYRGCDRKVYLPSGSKYFYTTVQQNIVSDNIQHMKATITAAWLLMLTLPVSGNNDNYAYLGSGSVIYPMEKTNISLEYQFLSFRVEDGYAKVDILFEFNNPGQTEKKLPVGFMILTPEGDIHENMTGKNLILDFRMMKDGYVLPYQLKVAACADCPLEDTGVIKTPGMYVYLFEVGFRPGINRISQSYGFFPSSGKLSGEAYPHLLTTGAKWADGNIGGLTVCIDMDPDKYFFVNDIFGPKASWEIIGSGKITGKIHYNDLPEDSCRMVRVLSGKLQIAVENFRYEDNIFFGTIKGNSPGYKNNRIIDSLRYALWYSIWDVWDIKRFLYSESRLGEYELKILRNIIYARYGYVFKSEDMQNYFSQFEWYIPDPNLVMEEIRLTEKEEELIEVIRNRERIYGNHPVERR